MAIMPIQWKIKTLLDQKGLTVYQFWKASGLAKGTAYRLANGKTNNLNTDTLDAAMKGLKELTGESLGISDILEWEAN